MNILRIKTDASTKPNVGFTIAYECNIHSNEGSIKKFSGSKFNDKQIKSTQAEVLGVAFGITESFKRFDKDPENFQIAIESDCQYAVDVYNKHKIKNEKLRKVAYPLLNKFDCWRVNWIPRKLNKRTNDLARERLRRAEDGL